MQNGRVKLSVIALGVAIPLAIVVGIAFLGGGDDDDDSASSTSAPGSTTSIVVDDGWNESLAVALRPLVDVLPRYAADVDAWSTGERSPEELTATLDELEPTLRGVRDATGDMPAHPRDPHARPLVIHTVDLYAAAFDAHRLALAASGDVAIQYDLLGRRLRILGDRAFDRARERTSAPVEIPDGITLSLPAEVPDWTQLGLAVGPPLESTDTNESGAVPRQRDDERDTQPTDDWVADVEALGVPSADDVREATGDAQGLAERARALVAAADAAREVPVPDGDRGRADRVALGWLILADAARAAQLGILEGDPSPLVEQLTLIASSDEFDLS